MNMRRSEGMMPRPVSKENLPEDVKNAEIEKFSPTEPPVVDMTKDIGTAISSLDNALEEKGGFKFDKAVEEFDIDTMLEINDEHENAKNDLQSVTDEEIETELDNLEQAA